MIEVLDQGIVYRNPKPYLRAIHAWHPSLVALGEHHLLAAFDLGQAVEALDYATYTSRSVDGGHTWSPPQPLLIDPVARPSTHSVRIGKVGGGELVGFGGRYYRDDPNEGLVNRANLGYVPMDLILLRSSNEGQTWQGPQTIQPPVVGPSFEICHRIVELRDGRWLAPTHHWRGWQGEAPEGMKAIALVSQDRGQTWPEALQVCDLYRDGMFSWEQGLTPLADGRLLAVVWCYDERAGRSQPNRYVVAEDGQTFGEPRENGLQGETAKLMTLPDGRVLCLYRRLDRPGLWAQLVEIEGQQWRNLEELALWTGPRSGMLGQQIAGDELSALKFGFPSLALLDSGDVFVVFWCVEDCLHIVRWMRLRCG